jgi:nucleoside 2-deoxyribosyltransferase
MPALEKTDVICPRCGKFYISRRALEDFERSLSDPKFQALASHAIQKLYVSADRPVGLLDNQFFRTLSKRTLPTPLEATDNLIIWLAEQSDGRPGRLIRVNYEDAAPLPATLGVINGGEVRWLVQSLESRGLVRIQQDSPIASLTTQGWQRFEELRRALISSNFAFFARKFDNSELNRVFDDCLYQAVQDTGYELRTVTQRAGLVDAIIEDEIRRCRFLIADLSDSNAGAYWEAGFAEGLGKPVIYICKTGCDVHFDTDHRHTVKWDLSDLPHTANQLKAVIRNTLLGDAKQSD